MGVSLQIIKHMMVQIFWSYGETNLLRALNHLSIHEADTVMVHASWHPNNGFRGSPAKFIAALKAAIGPDGLLTMTSLPYHNQSSAEYLAQGRPMDVRRTASRMGLLSEVFRRDPETQRSLSPTHPVLAWGRDAMEFVSGHEDRAVPFGSESPFERLLERDGKVLLVDTSLASITFTHYLEDRIKDQLPVLLYEPKPMEGIVIDQSGNAMAVPTYVISKSANAARDEGPFFAGLERARAVHRVRVGRTRLEMISCRKMVECLDQLVASGGSLFEFGSESPKKAERGRPL